MGARAPLRGSAIVPRRSAPDPLDDNEDLYMFQLVIQFASSDPNDLDRVVQTEDQLRAVDGLAESVDGHDVGQGEMNLFLITSTPEATFRTCLPILQASGLRLLGAAFRDEDGDSHSRIWPRGSTDPFEIA